MLLEHIKGNGLLEAQDDFCHIVQPQFLGSLAAVEIGRIDGLDDVSHLGLHLLGGKL